MLDPETARAWFYPGTILVAGVSRHGATLGNIFLRRQQELGYAGRMFVLHPDAREIEGVPCVRSIDEVGEPVDYAYVAVRGGDVPALFRQWRGRVRVAQVIASGFREVGAPGQELEAEMVRDARAEGIRLVGPNCIGTYSPGGRLTLVDGAPAEVGCIGVVSQSGVAAADTIKIGALLGARFSQVVSVGNCADVDAVDVYGYFVADPNTRIIGLYLEGLERGKDFLETAATVEGEKPTVILKGGLTEEGRRSASSHTGSLAEDHRIWRGLASQFGFLLKDSIEGFVHTLSSFFHWGVPLRDVGTRCCLVGPGGVLSVTGADQLRIAELDVPELSPQTIARLAELRLPPGHSLRNPIDTPVGVIAAQGGHAFEQILRIAASAREMDWLLVHLSIQNLFSYLDDGEKALADAMNGVLSAATDFRNGPRWALVLRTNGYPQLEPVRAAYRDKATRAGIPVFATISDAAAAIRDFVSFAAHRHLMTGGHV
jgi:acyl-CoA synthetase (NDP forming)